ncbi:MAG TPA: efflux RND transporter periplasmic adaptor subunit [Anaeromyxobacter sp.]|nr:efflux RND transporter periplasmic adaptor subunit [Anaeromyxobacter sp.]
MSRLALALALALAVPSLAASLLAACAPRAQAAQRGEAAAAIPVRLARVEPGPIAHPIRASGVVATKDGWDLAFKVGGLLARVEVRDGERVARGQVLARLDATELSAGVRQARAALEKARRDAVRVASLVAAESAPRAAAEDARTAQAIAEAQLAAAEFNLRHATIAAPDDGWVDRRLAEPGEVVAPGRPVLRVSGVGRGFVVRAALPERDVLDVGPGTRATVSLDADPGRPLSGRVTEVGRTAARGTGTYEVEVALDDPRARALPSGLTAKVEIARSVPAQGAVPLAAVVDGDGEEGAVFVVDGGVARRVPVRIALLAGDRAVLAGGIAGIEAVVADGAPRLADGARVEVR